MAETDPAPLAGKVALVTGSSRGIGRAIAMGLARAGADVVVTARTETPREDLPGTIHDTAEQVRALGRRALAVRADLTSDADIEALAGRAFDEFGRIDVLVNNAAEIGMSMYDSFWELSAENWDRQVRVNLTAPFRLCKAVAPRMRDRGGGLIVNISSGYGQNEIEEMPGGQGSPGVAYGATKAGLDRMTVGLAKELAPHGIGVVSVDPGFTLSEHCETLAPAGGIDPSFAHPMDLPAGIVVGLACGSDPLAKTGRVLSAAPMPETATVR